MSSFSLNKLIEIQKQPKFIKVFLLFIFNKKKEKKQMANHINNRYGEQRKAENQILYHTVKLNTIKQWTQFI